VLLFKWKLDDVYACHQNGISGIKHDARVRTITISCQIAGNLRFLTELALKISELELWNNSTGILYGVIAGIDAWKDADYL
jgi:hypothetical protein